MAVSREMVAQVGRNRRLSMKNCIYYFFEERKKGGKEKFIHVIKFRENSWKEFEVELGISGL